MSNKSFIKELQGIYKKGNIVPFLGAGLSMPFNVPDWGNLIEECALAMGIEDVNGASFLNVLKFDLDKYDYWEAVKTIKKYLNRTEEDIQSFIVSKINKCIPNELIGIENNYEDLAKYGFNLYFTTNYDHIIQKYLKTNYIPVNLKDVKTNIQDIMNGTDENRIFHLHGHISDSSSIVISQEKYKELYDNNVYKALFSVFSGVKTFLFVGFSFNDVFIQNIIKDNNEFFKSKHYIILPNPTHEDITYLKQTYNIETISYDPNKSSHQKEIRKIIEEICTIIPGDYENNSEEYEVPIDELPNMDEKQQLEKNLFCRKLRVENIDEIKVDYSKECFFTAEQYFRWLKKSGLKNSNKYADHFLALTYMKYKELLISTYEEDKDSKKFLKAVHKSLGNIEFTKLKKFISEDNMPNEINKQGFIHILADDMKSEKEVWWGEKRIESK